MGEIQRVIAETADAVIPEGNVRLAQPQLEMARNELAEVLAYLALEQTEHAVVPAKRVREKEVPQLPSRGLDVLGIADEEEIVLLLAEVKASDDVAHPPAVVESGESSLRAQLLAFLADRNKIIRELNWVFKHAPAAAQPLVAKALLLFARNDIKLAVVPVLVREEARSDPADIGTFGDTPEAFAPAAVRFCTIRLTEPIGALAEAVYRGARV